MKSPDIGATIKKTVLPVAMGVGLGIAGAQHIVSPPEPTTFPLERRIEGDAGTNALCRAGLRELESIMGTDDAEVITDKTWGSITNVFKEDFIKRDSLQLDPISLNCTPSLSETATEIEGVFEGNTPQIGVRFVSNFQNSPQGIKEKPIKLKSPVVDQKSLAKLVKIDSVSAEFTRTFDAEIKYFMGKAVDSSDPEQMRGRIKELEDIARKLINIREEALFVPDRNLSGFMTYVDDNRTGYGLYVTTSGDISGYTASIRLHEGLSGDKTAWKEVAGRHGMDPTKVSFDALLKKAVEALDRENTVRAIFKRPPCPASAEILRLAGKTESADYYAKLLNKG